MENVKKQSKSGSKGSAVEWSSAEDALVVQILTQEKAAGNQAESGWKPVVWEKAVNALLVFKANPPKKASHCKTRWQRIKGEYMIVKKLRAQSGFGWDEVRQMVTASKEVWEAYLKSHPKARPFMKRPFPLYDEVDALVSSVLATGAGASHLGAGYDSDDGEERTDALDMGVIDPVLLPHLPQDISLRQSSESEQSDIETNSNIKSTSSSFKHAFKSTPTTRSSSAAPVSKRRRKSHADSIIDVSMALHSIASAFAESKPEANAFPVTPERKKRALQTAEKEEGMSPIEIADVVEVFMDKDKADMYLSFTNLHSRNIWLKKALSKLQ